MTNGIKNICVFASSSCNLDKIYYGAARKLGLLIGSSGYNLVYGGSRRGLMYACAEAVKECGGKVFGVMPKKFADIGLANPKDCDEFYITPGMRERKAKMDELSDAVIALSGGFGTLEELSEIIVQKQLEYNNKPVVILNTGNFYGNLLEFFEYIIQENFAREDIKNLYFTANSEEEAVDYIKNYTSGKVYSKFSELQLTSLFEAGGLK